MASLNSFFKIVLCDDNGVAITEGDPGTMQIKIHDRWAREGQAESISMEEAKRRVFSGGFYLWDDSEATLALKLLLKAAERGGYTIEMLNSLCEGERFVEDKGDE